MNKFKVGDKVVRLPRANDSLFAHIQGDKDYYVVTSISNGRSFVQLDGVTYRYDPHPWYCKNFELYQEPEDEELPPAPKSVSYIKDYGRRKLVARSNGDSVNVLIRLSYRGITDAVGYSMEPDSALQLAHDLRRMAMEIKRKEKAQ
ncbi:MAG: hypothetical protein [Bacteriophage sp.]|nr:MAG: hypothetical protein [Bacteriophage sp.]